MQTFLNCLQRRYFDNQSFCLWTEKTSKTEHWTDWTESLHGPHLKVHFVTLQFVDLETLPKEDYLLEMSNPFPWEK